MSIKNKIDSGIVLKKATKKKEYVHNFNHAVFLTGRAVQELINAEQAHQHIIDFEYGGNYVLKETAELIKFKKGDLAVYSYILQHVANKCFTMLTHYEIGEALEFSTINSGTKKECPKVSKAIGRLCDTGYLINLKSIRGGKMIPLVRWENKETQTTPSDGFEIYLNEDEQELAYSRQSQATVRMANRAKEEIRYQKKLEENKKKPF